MIRLISALGICALAATLAYGVSNSDSLRNRVSNFCAAEFRGDQIDRVDFFSNAVRDKNAVDFVTEPVDIVDSYRIISVSIVGDKATVIVEYDLIAEMKNVTYDGYPGVEKLPGVRLYRADKLLSVHDPHYRQRLSWVFSRSESKWYLVSSQPPKISKESLLGLMQKEVRDQSDILRNNPGKPLPHIEASRSWNMKKIELIKSVKSTTK